LAPAARRPEDNDDSEVKKWFDGLKEKARDMDAGTYQAPEEPNPYQDVKPDADHWYDHIDQPEPVKKKTILTGLDAMWSRAKQLVVKDQEAEHAPLSQPIEEPEEFEDHIDELEKQAKRAWKEENPDGVLKTERQKLRNGQINRLPWQEPEFLTRVLAQTELEPDNSPTGPRGEVRGFGTSFPKDPVKGDMFLRVDQLPSVLYKYNGSNWIEVDKALSDQHAWNDAYIDHLIEKISSGEYDPELLSDAERERIAERLRADPPQA
jgi:hypothetical protein